MGKVCGRKHFIRTLTGRFPEVASRIDQYGRGLLHCEMGTFAHATKEALERGDLGTVTAHFLYADELLSVAGPELRNAIAVSYLESINFDKDYGLRTKPRLLLPPRLRQELADLEAYLEELFDRSK